MADSTEVIAKWYHKGWPMFVLGFGLAAILAAMGFTARWAWNKLAHRDAA